VGGEHLLLDAGRIHQLEPSADVVRKVRNTMAGDAGLDRHSDAREKPVAHEVAEVLRDIMIVDVHDHEAGPPCSEFHAAR